MIGYDEAVNEMDSIKQGYIDLAEYMEENYIKPKKMLEVPHKIIELSDRCDKVREAMIETWPNECEARTRLRIKWSEIRVEYEKSEHTSKDIEKRLLGMKNELNAKQEGKK